jgi:hypothetical protein
MLVIRGKLERQKGMFLDWEFVRKSYGGEGICRRWIWDHFDIPDDVDTIWLSLHTRSARERYEAEVKMHDNRLSDDSWPKIMVNGSYWDCESMDALLKKFVGKKLYLQCEYEA